jgi:hypothetical protein
LVLLKLISNPIFTPGELRSHNRSRDWRDRRIPSFVFIVSFVVITSFVNRSERRTSVSSA